MSSEEVDENEKVKLSVEEEESKCRIQVTAEIEPLDQSGEKSLNEDTPTETVKEQQEVQHEEDTEKENDHDEDSQVETDTETAPKDAEIDCVEKNLAKIFHDQDEAESQQSDVQTDSQDCDASQNNDSQEEENEDKYHAEYLDENAIKQELIDLPEEYEVEFLEDEELLDETFGTDNEKDKEYILPGYKVRSQKSKKSGEYISVAEQLREKYPELRHDTDKLVRELAEIMRQARPPPPPPNYYKIVVQSATEYQYECSYCGKKRPTLPLAARHYQFSHGEDYLTCLSCGCRHRNTTNLYKHEKRCAAPDSALVLRARGHYLGRKGRGRPYTTHHRFRTCNAKDKPPRGQRLFCSKCPASFAHRENLAAHEYSHEGVRPFHCNQCPARYTSAPAVRRHFLAMHGEQQYICDHCSASFKLKPLLVSHMDSHRAVRKHPCPHCPRRFAQKNALRHHINKVHLHLPPAHGCPLCPKRYPRMTQVKDHMARTHGLTMITRRMYYQSLPNLPQEALQVTLQPSIVNHQTNPNKSKHFMLPKPRHGKKQQIPSQVTIKEEVEEILPDWPLQEYVELDLRDTKDDAFISYVVIKDGVASKVNTGVKEEDVVNKILKKDTDEEEMLEEILEDDNEKILEDNNIEFLTCLEEAPIEFENVPNVPRILKRGRKMKRLLTPPVADDNFDTTTEFHSKRVKKEKLEIVNVPQANEENMHQVERDIKSTIKRTIKTKRTEPARIQPTVKPDIQAPGKPVKQPTAEDEQDWQEYKTIRAKNHVVAEFLEYMKSKKVPPKVYPKKVPILRKKIGPDPEPAGPSQWLENTREKIVTEPDPDEKVPPSVDIPGVVDTQ